MESACSSTERYILSVLQRTMYIKTHAYFQSPYPVRNLDVGFFLCSSWDCVVIGTLEQLWSDALLNTTNDHNGMDPTTHRPRAMRAIHLATAAPYLCTYNILISKRKLYSVCSKKYLFPVIKKYSIVHVNIFRLFSSKLFYVFLGHELWQVERALIIYCQC